VNAVVCACGRTIERGELLMPPTIDDLRAAGHDPDECSRQVGFQGRFDGRREMALLAVDHLSERGTLGGLEIAEIRTNLLDAVHSLTLGKVAS